MHYKDKDNPSVFTVDSCNQQQWNGTVCKDPRLWSREDVARWLQYVSTVHGLPAIKMERFLMNGKALCLMTIDMFVQRVPLGGKLLYKDFQLRLCSAMYARCTTSDDVRVNGCPTLTFVWRMANQLREQLGSAASYTFQENTSSDSIDVTLCGGTFAEHWSGQAWWRRQVSELPRKTSLPPVLLRVTGRFVLISSIMWWRPNCAKWIVTKGSRVRMTFLRAW